MSYASDDDGRLLPFDPETITAIRVDGSTSVTAVDPGTARAVSAGGETWLSWEHDGVRRAVNNRHIAEVFARRHAPQVIDLTEALEAFGSRAAVRS